MKLTLKHYYSFGQRTGAVGKNLISPHAWDAVRIDDQNPSTPFSIPETREAWVKKCLAHEAMVMRAVAINAFIANHGFEKVVSLGAGAGFVEYNIKHQNPGITLECSDYSVRSVERLKKMFPEATVHLFDMLNGSFSDQGLKTLYLLHRIDTDFTNAQWMDIFGRMHEAGIENVLFVPCDITSAASMAREIGSYWYQKLVKKNPLSFVGYLRNENQFRALFGRWYVVAKKLPVADLVGFYIKKK